MAASRRPSARRDEILEAAAGVLAGSDGASMGDVAAAAGISRGTLYRYFPNRESLLLALEIILRTVPVVLRFTGR